MKNFSNYEPLVALTVERNICMCLASYLIHRAVAVAFQPGIDIALRESYALSLAQGEEAYLPACSQLVDVLDAYAKHLCQILNRVNLSHYRML